LLPGADIFSLLFIFADCQLIAFAASFRFRAAAFASSDGRFRQMFAVFRCCQSFERFQMPIISPSLTPPALRH